MTIVAVFDPYPVMGVGFAQIFEENGAEMESRIVSTIDALRQLKANASPDVLLLTVNTPRGQDPLLLLEDCKTLLPGVPIVFYDEEHRTDFVRDFLQTDISGYLLKSEAPKVVLQCIDSVLKGARFISPLSWSRYWGGTPALMPARPPRLAPKELQIARYLCEGKSTNWIADKLGKKPSTISTVKSRIFFKLSIDNVIDLSRILDIVI